MTYVAKGDEIFLHIATQNASQLNVMDLEIFGTSASLASPTVAVKYLPPEFPIGISVQAKPALSQDARVVPLLA